MIYEKKNEYKRSNYNRYRNQKLVKFLIIFVVVFFILFIPCLFWFSFGNAINHVNYLDQQREIVAQQIS